MTPGKLVLIIGPSGVGKSVILQELRQRHGSSKLTTSSEFHFPRSATTRERREGEGDDLYHFLSETDFQGLMSQDKFLEWAEVHGGAHYGTLVDEIIPYIQKGKTVIREVDVQGFDSIRRHPLFAGSPPQYTLQSIFILPENKEQLVTHITKRAPIAPDELKRRIASMEKELAFARECTASVLNREGRLEETIREIEGLLA